MIYIDTIEEASGRHQGNMPCNAGAVYAWMKIVVLFRTERAKSGYGYLYLHDAKDLLGD